MSGRRNWRQLAALSWQMLLWLVLGFFWLIWLDVFFWKMLPRLGYLTGKPIGADSPCSNPECDFSAFWPAGLLARKGEFIQLYDGVSFYEFQRSVFGTWATHLAGFFYPPVTLLPSTLISYLPFEYGFFVWVSCFTALSVWLLHISGFSWRVILPVILCPAAIWNAELGQWGVIDAALLVAGLMGSLTNRKWAGWALGLLAFKPQAGILVPACLLGGKNKQDIFRFCVTLLLLTGATLVFFGPDVWKAFFTFGHKQTLDVLYAPFFENNYEESGISVFWMVRSLGAGLQLAFTIQTIFTLLAMLFVFLIWRHRNLPLLDKVALAVLLSLLATPYGYVNDMVAGACVLAALMERRGWTLKITDVLFWLWPAFCQIISRETGVLFTPLVVILASFQVAYNAGLFRRNQALNLA